MSPTQHKKNPETQPERNTEKDPVDAPKKDPGINDEGPDLTNNHRKDPLGELICLRLLHGFAYFFN